MTALGVIMAKDEGDIIAATLERMAPELDGILAIDNASTDGTRELLAAHPAVLELIDEPEVGYYQSVRMTRLARRAFELGADWVVPFDADERWYALDRGLRIADALERVNPSVSIVHAELFDHVTTDLDDPLELDPMVRVAWRRRAPGALPKVAARARRDLVIEMGNHGARYATEETTTAGVLELRHFPYRSPAQFVSKVRNGAAAYAASSLPETFGAHWRGYGRILEELGEDGLVETVYRAHFHAKDPEAADDLVLDPAP